MFLALFRVYLVLATLFEFPPLYETLFKGTTPRLMVRKNEVLPPGVEQRVRYLWAFFLFTLVATRVGVAVDDFQSRALTAVACAVHVAEIGLLMALLPLNRFVLATHWVIGAAVLQAAFFVVALLL